MLAHSISRFHLYFHVQITLHHADISLSHEDGFSKIENSYIRSANCILHIVCDDYGINADEKRMNVDCF